MTTIRFSNGGAKYKPDPKKTIKMSLCLMLVFYSWSQHLIEATKTNTLLKDIANGLDDSPSVNAYSSDGGQGFLPCDITPPLKEDFPILIVFFRGSEPIYSVDARDGNMKNAVHWSSPSMKYKRLSFSLRSSPFGLELPTVTSDDCGDYHCRVDFLNSPTRNIRVKLHVAVPPSRMTITNDDGNSIGNIAGPVPVGADLTLMCRVFGGEPRPKVTWWLNNELIDNTVEESHNSVISNSLTLPNLTRRLLSSELMCQASNSELTETVRKTVTIDMYFPPLDATIKGLDIPLIEGQAYQITCSSYGSRPPSNITWWKDGRQMKNTGDHQTYSSPNNSVSTLTITPTRTDNGSNQACRSVNGHLQGTAVEDSRRMIVQYAPELHINPGKGINLENIREGEDVYLECASAANPPVKNVAWFFNDQILQNNPDRNILITLKTVIFQKIRASSAGYYVCKGSNIIGSAISNKVYIDVKYAPKCDRGQKLIYGGTANQQINVSCSVTGNPSPDFFYWSFNSTSEEINLFSHLTHSRAGHSILRYVPASHLDFGSILCFAENTVGKQRVPCIYQIVPASAPDSVRNCSLWHNTSEEDSLHISCLRGWDGGLAQTFVLQIKCQSSGAVILEDQENKDPVFSVKNLPPGTELVLTVYAQNSQGWSSSVEFIHLTPIDIAERRLSPETADAPPNYEVSVRLKKMGIIAVICVCVTTVFFLVLTITLRIHNWRKSPKKSEKETSVGSTMEENLTVADSIDPDIIMVSSDLVKNSSEKSNIKGSWSHQRTCKDTYEKSLIPESLENLTTSLEPESLMSCTKNLAFKIRLQINSDGPVHSSSPSGSGQSLGNISNGSYCQSLLTEYQFDHPCNNVNPSKILQQASRCASSEGNPLIVRSLNFDYPFKKS